MHYSKQARQWWEAKNVLYDFVIHTEIHIPSLLVGSPRPMTTNMLFVNYTTCRKSGLHIHL